MAYTKKTGSPNHIIFYYPKSDMFDNIELKTMYRARNMKDDKGNSLIDDFAMSSDEEDAFLVLMKRAVNEVLNIVLKMTTGVSSSLSGLPGTVFFDDTITDSGGTSIANVYGFAIVNEDAYNDNNLLTVDDGVKKFLEHHVLSAWWDLVGFKDEYTIELARLEDIRRDLITHRLFQLRKPKIS